MATAFSTIDDFEVILSTILGEGTFGAVYLAKQISEDKAVAAKNLKKYELDPNDKYVKEEIENLNKLPRHANLVTVLHHQQYGTQYWIFMELCDLGDLKSYFQKIRPDLKLKLHVMLETAKGLCFLHENNIIHRDMKPRNILLQTAAPSAPPGAPPSVKITDFGFSKFLSEGKIRVVAALKHQLKKLGKRTVQETKSGKKSLLWRGTV